MRPHERSGVSYNHIRAVGIDAIHQVNQVGRLLETRIRGLMAVEDVTKLRDGLYAIIAKQPLLLISAIDLRASATQGRNQIASGLLQLFKDTNDRIERTGILVGPDPLMPIQVESILVQAKHPGRRAFHDPEALIAYLSELSSPEETARLREFLSEQ
jgi:hypothetical protein